MASLEEQSEQDKRRAAWHEAGHLTVLYAKGGQGRAHVEPTHATDLIHNSAWRGQCQTVGGCMCPVVCIAGKVAEEMMSEDSLIGADGDVVDWLEYDYGDALLEELSRTDRERIPDDITYDDLLAIVKEAHALIVGNRAFFDWCVRELIEGEIVTDGMATEQFNEMARE